MLIWNGTRYARMGGGMVTTEDPIFAKRDQWSKLQHAWINTPLDLNAPLEERYQQLAASEEAYKKANSFWHMNHL